MISRDTMFSIAIIWVSVTFIICYSMHLEHFEKMAKLENYTVNVSTEGTFYELPVSEPSLTIRPGNPICYCQTHGWMMACQ
jgi:hypothetical protein